MIRYLGFLAAAFLLAATSHAGILPIHVTGILDTIADDDGGAFAEVGVGLGSTVSATFYFDTETPDTNGDPLRGLFPYAVTGFEISAGDWSIEASADLFSYSTVQTIDWPAGQFPEDQPWGDLWQLNAYLLAPIVPDVGPQLKSITLLFAYDLSGTMLEDDGIIPVGDVLNVFPVAKLLFAKHPASPTGDSPPTYDFFLDAATVPEPNVVWLSIVSLLPLLVRAGLRP